MKKMTDYKNIRNFDELIEREHGKIGTDSRNEYEERAQMFIVSEMLKVARHEANLTQEHTSFFPSPCLQGLYRNPQSNLRKKLSVLP